MVLLAYQSTGSEENDRIEIEKRLARNKKVAVRALGCKEWVHRQLVELFGLDSVGEGMKLIAEDNVTHVQEWQCDLHRSAMKLGNHSREILRKETQTTKLAECIKEEQEPLTVDEFIQQLQKEAASIAVDTFDLTEIPTNLTEILQNRYNLDHQNNSISDESLKQLAGDIAEVMVPIVLNQQLDRGLFHRIMPVHASELHTLDDEFRIESGGLPHQIVFKRRFQHAGEYFPYTELDILFRTNGQEYFTLDITAHAAKEFNDKKRVRKLQSIQEVLGQKVTLIDVLLRKEPFSFKKMREDAYLWTLPSTVDLTMLVSKFIHWDGTPSTLEKIEKNPRCFRS